MGDGDHRTTTPATHRVPRNGRRHLAAATLALFALAGCGRDPDTVEFEQVVAKVKDGSAKRELQAYFDKHPQCALVLYTDVDADLLVGTPNHRATRALISAGLIERVGNLTTSSLDVEQHYYRPTASARKWFSRIESSPQRRYTLCYAKRRVNEVWVNLDPTTIGYSFNLTDQPAWARSPAILEAFPILDAANGPEFMGNERLTYQDGSLTRNQIRATELHGTLAMFEVDFRAR